VLGRHRRQPNTSDAQCVKGSTFLEGLNETFLVLILKVPNLINDPT